MKGIILAGGTGSRLRPLTSVISKQLLPVYDKPLIYYPLATLMLAGIREILIVSTPSDATAFTALLGDGDQLGMNLSYVSQPEPGGIAQALILGSEFVGGRRSALVLGDNIFHGPMLGGSLARFGEGNTASIFAYEVSDPSRYAVVSLSEFGVPIDLAEKPVLPASNLAVPGLYFYPPDAPDLAMTLLPSARGELEITDLNNLYLTQGRLDVTVLPRGTAWLDAGTPTSLADAAQYVRLIEERQGLRVGCIEEVAWRNGWIDQGQLFDLGAQLGACPYGEYLRGLASSA